MNINNQIEHALDLEARIDEVIEEMQNWPNEMVDPCYVSKRLSGILSRYSDARFEAKCRGADFSITD